MKVRGVRTRIFKESEDIVAFVRRHIPKLREGSVLAITSKIVALSEGRTAATRDKERLIKKESTWTLRTHKEWWWTEKDGMLLVNAGIDDSNADGKLVLLPHDSFASAQRIYSNILQNYGIRKCGVIITDSRISPMRAGVTGLALGFAGFRGVRDYRGTKDLFGKKLRVTMTDIADSLATAATLVMGEGAERQPLAIIEDAPVEFVDGFDKLTTRRKEVQISAKDDMYAPLFRRAGSKKRKKRRG